ncbi:MAG: hypothetical protein ACE3L7_04200 [Candidatus Pristimantibacillus sp.]
MTNKGRALQAKAQAGSALVYTRVGMGDGTLSGQLIPSLTAFISLKKSLNITTLKPESIGRALIGTSYSNSDVVTGFYFRELGVFANDPDEGEILYCYGNAGAAADYIPAGGGADIVEEHIDISVIFGNATSVSAVINSSLVYVTKNEFEGAIGDMSMLPTTAKDAAGAITELFTNVSDGKFIVAAAITDKGVPTAESDTFTQMAVNITGIKTGVETGDATVAAGDIRIGKTGYGAAGTKITGTVPVQPGGNVIPAAVDIVKPSGIYDTAITVKGVVVPATKVLSDTTIAGTKGTMTKHAGPIAAHSTAQWANGDLAVYPLTGYYELGAAELRVAVAQLQAAEVDLVPSNIRSGINMFGITGSLKEIKRVTGTVVSSNVTAVFTTHGGNMSYYYVEITGHDCEVETVVLSAGSAGTRRIIYNKGFNYSGMVGCDTIQVSTNTTNNQTYYAYTQDPLVVSPTLIRLPVGNLGSTFSYVITSF